MSPPIYTPDGSEVSEIVLPDGSTASEVIGPDGNVVFEAPPDIPDESIYLHDDWGDNKLQNREGTATTTTNGVTGTYRPEWTIDNGTPEATNTELTMATGDTLHTAINLDFSSKITWRWYNVDNLGSDRLIMVPFSEGTYAVGGSDLINTAYNLTANSTDIRFYWVDSNGNTNKIIGNLSTPSTPFDMRLERASDGTWTLFTNGNDRGSGTDTTSTTDDDSGFHGRGSSGGGTVEEYKVEPP
jgi:hypothetical protein